MRKALVNQIKIEAGLAVPYAERGKRGMFRNDKHPRDQSLPLIGYMAGIRGSQSKIMTVVNDNTTWAYTTYSAITDVVTDRLAKKYKITNVQACVLYDTLSLFYRGRGRDRLTYMYGDLSGFGGKTPPEKFIKSLDFFRACLDKAKIQGKVPLRVILSPSITSLLLIYQLGEIL